MVSRKPTELIALGVVSISGWLIFEYLNIFLRIGLALDEGEAIPSGRFIFKPTFGTTILGSDRADDYFTTELDLEFPRAFCEPQFVFRSTLHLDPLPAREDLVDTTTGEIQGGL